MAGPVYVRKRVFNPELLIDPDGVLPQGLRNTQIHGNNPVYYIKWLGATQGVGAEELGTAKTATKDGTTTPYLVNVVSSSVLDDYDDTATGAVRSVAIIGPSVSSVAAYTAGEVPKQTVEVLRTNGTADVVSTRYFVWLDHAYACQWAAEFDAAGTIDLEAPSGDVQIVITAAQNEGEGGEWHFPPDRRLFIHSVKLESTAAMTATQGIILYNTCTCFDDALNSEPDLDTDIYAMVAGAGDWREYRPINPLGRYTTINSSSEWSEKYIVGTENINIEIIQYLDR